MLSHITPVILTFNEGPNIARALSRLDWAKDIVVVDSGSIDDTLEILGRFPKVRVYSRLFDTHANQWRYATQDTAIATPWVLRLDADYQLSDALVSEISGLDPNAPVSAYRIAFGYAIFSRPLRSSLYPANTILLRVGKYSVRDKGHTEVWTVDGPTADLRGRIVHDDWKSTKPWAAAQGRYMERELERLFVSPNGIRDWLRLHPPLMPLALFLYCLFAKGLILDGKPGLYYAFQRLVAESILALMVIERRIKGRK